MDDMAMQALIFVVTLRGDEKRRRRLLDKLHSLGLDYELFYGIDARNGLPEECLPLVDRTGARRNTGREITDGELACALSHRGVYCEVLRRGLAGAIVLEDDAVPTESFAHFARTRVFQLSDLTMLYHSRTRVWRWGSRRLNGFRFYRLALPSRGTVGYALSRLGAEMLFRAATPVSNVADWPLDVSSIGSVAAWPCLVEHDPPLLASSYLAAERESRMSTLRRGRKPLSQRLSRQTTCEYWNRWFRKQLSMRIS